MAPSDGNIAAPMEPVATDDVFEADPGSFPRSRSEPRSNKKL
jgi:hypothetical protein